VVGFVELSETFLESVLARKQRKTRKENRNSPGYALISL